MADDLTSELQQKLRTAVKQWRDALVNLSGRNRLLNYRATKSSTIEYTRSSPSEVFERIASDALTFTVGTRPPERPIAGETDIDDESVTSRQLEDAVIEQLEEFDVERYPDQLFTDRTQKDVDRILRNLAASSRREFLDKGLRTLYVALGELRWYEESGDARRSPLLLVPAELVAPGPRERMCIEFSDDDTAVNPALGLKLLDEWGLELPKSENVLAALETDGVGAALGLFAEIDWPEGWEVRDFSALGTFMFAKEAMYRDLLENEAQIIEEPLIAALAGATEVEKSAFAFEPYEESEIDVVSPPESTPLVLDADAHQRAAIAAALEGKSFTLDGPPGTGKSQTIANMIGALIGVGKTVLFVSEKAVALDVVRDRLASRGLDHFLFELHSSKAVRQEVASRLGAALATRPVAPTGAAVSSGQVRVARESLTNYSNAMNEIREPLRASFHEISGRLEQIRSNFVGAPFVGDATALNDEDLDEVVRWLGVLSRHWDLHRQGRGATWFGLERGGDLRFTLLRLAEQYDRIGYALDDAASLRRELGLTGLGDLTRVSELLDVWHRSPEFHDLEWPVLDNLTRVHEEAISYAAAANDLERAVALAAGSLGAGWRNVPVFPDAIPIADEMLRNSVGLSAQSTVEELRQVSESVAQSSAGLAEIVEISKELSAVAGMRDADTLNEMDTLIDLARGVASPEYPLAAWVVQPARLEHAVDAVRAFVATSDRAREMDGSARATYNDALLESDLSAIEELARDTRGLFKRFGSQHRELRRRLSSVSNRPWKVALRDLHIARNWYDAVHSFDAARENARKVLDPLYDGGLFLDRDRFELRFANARALSSGPISSEVALSEALSTDATRDRVGRLLADLDRALSLWRASGLSWAQPTGVDGSTVAALIASLADRRRLIDPFMKLVRAHEGHTSSDLSLGEHVEAARHRAEQASTEERAQHLRARLGRYVESDRLEPTALGAERLARELAWSAGIVTAARGDASGAGLRPSQLDALRQTPSLPGATEAVIALKASIEELLDLFAPERRPDLSADFDSPDLGPEAVATFLNSIDRTDDWFSLRRAHEALERVGLGRAIDYARERQVDADDVSDVLLAALYRGWLDTQLRVDDRLDGDGSLDRDELVERFRQLDAELAKTAVSQIIEAGVSRRPRSGAGQSAIIMRESQKKRRHIAVRELIAQARDVILAVHPCFMMSPLAVSQYLPADRLFDVVIFDEASQVLPSDAINCIYRGRALITAGDQKQLPPTSFFAAAGTDLDDSDDEDVANDFESVLDLMKSSGAFTAQSLRWHYRSRHEHLIAYSNASFYNSKLITFPGAVDSDANRGVHFIKIDGVYRRSAGQDNPVEARHVAQRVMQHYATRPDKTLGVVAFSTAQRDAIESAIELARSDHPELDRFFGDDRMSGFFVKSLESVQGDERDVIIFSIGYGPDENGKVYNNFGPVSRNGGERRLNVAITRAKELVEIVSSISASDIGDVASSGGRHLRRYLDFAERGPAALAMELGDEGLDTESPFEDSVVAFIRELGFDVQPQVGVAGFRIDVGVKHPTRPGSFMLGVECDGAMYHSSRTARDRDRLRHQVLEGLGWRLHHIWGTSWYRHPEREKQRLRELLEHLAGQDMVGRVGGAPQVDVPIDVEVEQAPMADRPAWVADYETAQLKRISFSVDLGDEHRARDIVQFVLDVAEIETPIHIDILAQRLREHSWVDRIGARIRATLLRAVKLSKLNFDGEFVRVPGRSVAAVRQGGRTIAQVAPEELRRAITLTAGDAVGIDRDELVVRAAGVFGWKRTGSDIRARLSGLVAEMLIDGALVESAAGLRPGNQDTV